MSTTVPLSTRQKNLIAAARKPEAQKPTYYNSLLRQNVKISDDFEAFLILSGSERNRSAQQWITDSESLAADNSDRDGVLYEWVSSELDDVKATLEEVEGDLESFNSFREEFQSNQFAGVAEVQMMLHDLQQQAAELFTLQDRLRHRVRMLTNVQDLLIDGGVTEQQLKQTVSWVRALGAY